MISIKPFKAIRPTRDKASLVASRSYLSYSEETLKEKLEHNPFTFLHIINPDYKNKINGIKSTGYENSKGTRIGPSYFYISKIYNKYYKK